MRQEATDSKPGRFRTSWKTVLAMLDLSWQAYPLGVLSTLIFDAIQGLLPLGTAWITKALFDLLAEALPVGTSPDFERRLMLLVVAQVMLLLIGHGLTALSSYQQSELGRRLSLEVQERVYAKVNSFAGLAYFEDPRFQDSLQLAVQGAEQQPRDTLATILSMFRALMTLGAFLSVLLALDSWLALLVLAAALPHLLIQLRLGQQNLQVAADTMTDQRRAQTYRLVLSLERYAKELRLFQLGPFFLDTLLRCERRIQAANRRLEQKQLTAQLIPNSLRSFVPAAAFLVVARRALAGTITLGDVSLYLAAVSSVQGSLAGLFSGIARLHEGHLFFSHYLHLMSLPQPIAISPTPRPLPNLKIGLELRNVSFRYSPEHPWILRDLNLRIPAGKTLALVGPNGAGKTTLVKLLSRLYDPTEGAILWDGVDLRHFSPDDVRRQLGTVLQDFARYDLTVRENIGLGQAEQIRDTGRIRAAAYTAGIHDVIERLPSGYETFLNRWLAQTGSTGAELSGGEWQRIAIARMFMRNASLLILDEPTAALDAQAELEVFERFATLTAGHTSVVISHRFSTVRTADQIAVLEDGKITELGTHQELLAADKTYARLFRIQAERFCTASPTESENTPSGNGNLYGELGH